MPARKPASRSVGAVSVRKNPLRVAGDPVPVIGSAAPVVAPLRLADRVHATRDAADDDQRVRGLAADAD
jgi:hypothetical protein